METLKKQTSECDFVRFTWSDLHGIARGRYIPRKSVEQFLEEGVKMFSGTIALGPRSQMACVEQVGEFGNAASLPMPGTFHMLPWAGAGKYKVGEVLCETFWSPGKPQEACPRYIARKQLQRLAEFGCTLCSGWEEEFMLLHQDTQEPIFQGHDYISHLIFNEHEQFYLELQMLLEEAGIEIEGLANEYAPGQMELATKPIKDIRGVDMAFNFKAAVKEISAHEGIQAVFMAKPYPERSGNGLHYNFSFSDPKETNEKANLFFDEESDDKLSDFARHFLGGLIKHAAAMTAFCCPTINCYRRLHKPWAPDKIVWGIDNRLTFVRVKTDGSQGPYMENRLPSAAANPYLVVAATLAAGLDGVSNKIEPPPPMEKAPKEFPHSLQEAIQALEEDIVLKKALGEEFVDWFITTKKLIECEELKDCDMNETDPKALEKECDMYFKFI